MGERRGIRGGGRGKQNFMHRFCGLFVSPALACMPHQLFWQCVPASPTLMSHQLWQMPHQLIHRGAVVTKVCRWSVGTAWAVIDITPLSKKTGGSVMIVAECNGPTSSWLSAPPALGIKPHQLTALSPTSSWLRASPALGLVPHQLSA